MKAGSIVAVKSNPEVRMTVRSLSGVRVSTVWFTPDFTLKQSEFNLAELTLISE